MIVEALYGGVGLAGPCQHGADRLLGSGLPGAAGYSHDPSIAAGTGRTAEVHQTAQRVRHHDQPVAEARGLFLADQRGDGAVVERLLHEVMTVVPIALDGDEQPLGRDFARIDGQAADAVTGVEGPNQWRLKTLWMSCG